MSRIFDTLKKFPSTDFHELNLDWIIKKIKDLDTMFHDIQVTSFNGRKGDVVPKIGDYNLRMIEGLDNLLYGQNEIGRNKWNEAWEVGNIIFSTGLPNPNENCIRSVDYCECKPNTSYYLHCGSAGNIYFIYIFFYDVNKTFINGKYAANSNFVTPTNAKYFKITSQTASTATYGNVYKNDISVVEGTSGSYEPYIPYSMKVLGSKSDDVEFLGWSVPGGMPVKNFRLRP